MRPPLTGKRLIVRSIGLPAALWARLDEEARRRSLNEKRNISTAQVIREKLNATR